MKVITADIGNTNIVIASFENDTKEMQERLETRSKWTLPSMTAALRKCLLKNRISADEIDGSILSSVVPELSSTLAQALEAITGKPVMIMTPTLSSGIGTGRYDEATLGSDRIVDMAAAAAFYKGPAAIWDLGTATTLSVIDRNHEFIGGMISAGVQLSLTALAEHTSQLPQLSPEATDSLLGTDTVANMISGSVASTGIMIGGTAGRLSRMPDLEGIKFIITGGLGQLVLPWINRDVIYDPDLQLKGMLTIYRKNRP